MGFLPWGGKGGEPPLAEASNTSKKQQKAAPPKPTNRWQEVGAANQTVSECIPFCTYLASDALRGGRGGCNGTSVDGAH
jgi:hypothetical protein